MTAPKQPRAAPSEPLPTPPEPSRESIRREALEDIEKVVWHLSTAQHFDCDTAACARHVSATLFRAIERIRRSSARIRDLAAAPSQPKEGQP